MCDVAVHTKRKVTAQMLSRFDPTHTTALRNTFAKDMKRRFRELEKVIWQAIVVEDCFGLNKPGMALHQMGTPGHAAFAFARSDAKVAEFMKWMNAQVESGILTAKDLSQLGTSVDAAWTNKYVYDSYQRGVIRARYELQKAGFGVPSIEQTGGIGISMGTPFHMDRLGLLYSRVFTELKGITQAMDSQISRVLSQGLMDGDNPRRLASRLISTINGTRMGDLAITDTLGRFIPAARRAGMLARTEVIRAHHQATIQEYKNWGAAGVAVRAEWSAVGDSETCERCSSMNGKVFTLAEIGGMIPAHPHCRCIAIPTNKGLAEEATRTRTGAAEIKNSKVLKEMDPIYHGTSKEAAESILRTGLRLGDGGKIWGATELEHSLAYAIHAGKTEETAVVVIRNVAGNPFTGIGKRKVPLVWESTSPIDPQFIKEVQIFDKKMLQEAQSQVTSGFSMWKIRPKYVIKPGDLPVHQKAKRKYVYVPIRIE